jgi:hypothetical protein
LDFVTIYEDTDLMIIAKPSGLPVLPGGGFLQNTLLYQLQQRYPQEMPVPIHRLGRGTSGLMLIARSSLAKSKLSQQMRDRQITKIYRALIGPSELPTEFTINQAIVKIPHPILGYLYGAYGNPALKPEYASSLEAGIQYSDGPTIMRATVFETRTTDQFQWVSTSFTNVKKTRNQGLEVSAMQYFLTWELRASLTLQDPIDLSTDERLIRRPALLGSFGATTKIDQWRIGGDVSYTGSRSDTSATLAAYWLANATARYQVDKKLSVFGRIENLFDADYQTAWGYNQARRGVFVGLNWQP